MKKIQGIRFLCLSLAVLLIASVCIWGFQTDWGYVKIERITISGDNGSTISSLIYIPNTATNETPAPLVMMFHGRSNQAHSNDTWNMELARRGYVVVSPDLAGGGESDVTDRNAQAVDLTKYAVTMDFVQKDNVICIGYSAGCQTCNAVAQALPENVGTIVAALGPNLTTPIEGVNTGVIKAIADQYNWMFVGDVQACADAITERFALPEPVVPGKYYDLNGSTFAYLICEDALHQTGNISGDTLNNLLSYVTTVVPAPRTLELADQAWLWQQLFSGVACVTMMFVLAAVLNVLMQTNFFGSMSFKRVARKELRGWKNWLVDILFCFVIPCVLFIPVSAYGMSWFGESKIFTSTNLNGIMVWLVLCLALIGVVRTALKAVKRKKAGETITAADYCLAPEGGKFQWNWIAKSLLLGVVVTAAFGLWMTAIESYMGINYQVWNLSTYLKPCGYRVVRSIPYMLVIGAVMFCGNINQRVLPSTGNERKDLWIAVTVNTVLTALALFVLLVVQYGGNLMIGTGQAVFEQMTLPGVKGTSVGALDFAFGYCYMMGGTTGVVTYIYRKHGNVLPAVIACAIFAGLFTTLGFTLVR